MRTLRLSKNLTFDIHTTCQHHIDNTDRSLSQDYEELRDMTNHSERFRLVVTLEEKIPVTSDTLFNIVAQYIMDLVDADEDDTEEMNALYMYLEDVWRWDGEAHPYLLKATTEEAIEYLARWLINTMGGDA